jgi:YrbI family 3-deoxy-D-manno-octulosonate 8-phosphate phosphatase
MTFPALTTEVEAAARKIKLLLMDCDGVLTDGRLYFSAKGEELKVFNVRDGQGLVNWHRAGFRSGIVSGRGAGEIIKRRADELGVEFVRTGSADKTKEFFEILKAAGVEPKETAYIGDDIGDIEIMKLSGLAIAVADAVAETQAAAAFITAAAGGHGAVREVTDLLLFVKKNQVSARR